MTLNDSRTTHHGSLENTVSKSVLVFVVIFSWFPIPESEDISLINNKHEDPSSERERAVPAAGEAGALMGSLCQGAAPTAGLAGLHGKGGAFPACGSAPL